MLCTPLNLIPQHVGSGGSGHDELRLQVGLDVGLPHWIIKVQVQGALAGHAAVAVAAASFAVWQPLIRSALVSPGLSAQALLLHQQLQAFHLTAGCTVLSLTYTVTWRKEKKEERGDQMGISLCMGTDLFTVNRSEKDVKVCVSIWV